VYDHLSVVSPSIHALYGLQRTEQYRMLHEAPLSDDAQELDDSGTTMPPDDCTDHTMARRWPG
jgi:hypothetical protein